MLKSISVIRIAESTLAILLAAGIMAGSLKVADVLGGNFVPSLIFGAKGPVEGVFAQAMVDRMIREAVKKAVKESVRTADQ